MKKIILLVSFVMLLGMMSLVIAAKPEMNNSVKVNDSVKMEKADKVVKNMTYGACVSENAKMKNDCFASVKEARSNCLVNASDSSMCKADYKKNLNQCKTVFKNAKKECKKIKHNFIETARYAFD